MAPSKITIMVPTYNERGKIEPLIDQLLALTVPGHELHVLVVDDDSPDGTGSYVTERSRAEPRLKVVVRKGRRGRGTAGIEGFREALRHGACAVVEMDADFSHDPRYLPAIIAAADAGASIVIGSRFVPGGADMDRGAFRRMLSLAAGSYLRAVLGLTVKDITSGYRLFSRSALEAMELDNMLSEGPSILQEMLYKAATKGYDTVAEVPIVFVDRRVGSSKLDAKRLIECLKMALRIRKLHRRGQLFKTTASA